MSHEYAWLCKVDFGLVVCFPNLVCIQLSCRFLCNDMKKHIISEGFFIDNPILLFFFFFHSTESLCNNPLFILNPRGQAWGLRQPHLPTTRPVRVNLSTALQQRPYLSRTHLTQSKFFHAHRGRPLSLNCMSKTHKNTNEYGRETQVADSMCYF